MRYFTTCGHILNAVNILRQLCLNFYFESSKREFLRSYDMDCANTMAHR